MFGSQPDFMAGDDDDGDRGSQAMHQTHRLQTVHGRHEDVDDEKVERAGPKQIETFAAIIGDDDVVSLAFKQYPDGRQNGVIIVDDENACHGTRSVIRRPTYGCRLCRFVTKHKLDVSPWSGVGIGPRKPASSWYLRRCRWRSATDD